MNSTVSTAVLADVQAMLNDPGLTEDEEQAALLTISAYRSRGRVDHHIVHVLHGYAKKHGIQQDRWGR